jgi:hypothetical protein
MEKRKVLSIGISKLLKDNTVDAPLVKIEEALDTILGQENPNKQLNSLPKILIEESKFFGPEILALSEKLKINFMQLNSRIENMGINEQLLLSKNKIEETKMI